MSMKIIVPASTANLGPGFDSVGMALNLYLTVTICHPSTNWKVNHPFGEEVPSDEDNLIVETALSICPSLQPYELLVESEIPLTRGLGSSGSAIVAGIEVANQLGKLGLSQEEKVQIAAEIEGHPDNVVPSILGGIVVGATLPNKTSYCRLGNPFFELIAMIPEEELKTSLSRSVLPHTLSYSEAITGSAVANVLVSALATNNEEVLKEILEKDSFHEPYRQELLPHFNRVRKHVSEKQGIGVVLSGAGPTLLVFTSKFNVEELHTHLVNEFSDEYTIHRIGVDPSGVQIVEEVVKS